MRAHITKDPNVHERHNNIVDQLAKLAVTDGENRRKPDPPKGPWEFLQVDFIGPLPSARGGYRYCLVIIDTFSEWVEAIPTCNNTATTVARVLANQIIPHWGAPMQIESDQRFSTNFTGQVTKSVCKMLNIVQKFHVPYRPQSSGMVERVNRTIKEGIAKQMAQHQNRWTEALPTVLTILRATPSKATGVSPYELMTGRVMRLPIDPEISPADLGPLVLAKQQGVLEQLRKWLKVFHAQAALKQHQADLQNDAQFNPTSEITFAEGDMVMISVLVKQNAFAPRWHGPYEVKAVCHSCIAVGTQNHMNQCKLFKGVGGITNCVSLHVFTSKHVCCPEDLLQLVVRSSPFVLFSITMATDIPFQSDKTHGSICITYCKMPLF